MEDLFAALPMYDWPEEREANDAEWTRIAKRLCAAGIAAPRTLVRRNADLPPVPGGIRDASGRAVAPDPAALPPDSLDLHALWRHPRLLLAQTCWGPMERGLAGDVTVVAQPDYSGFEGGRGELYSSAILMRAPAAAPKPGRASSDPAISKTLIDALRGTRFAFNGADSLSGFLAPSRDLEALGEGLGIFARRIETGAHRASIVAVAEGRADACAVDSRTWHLARLHEPYAGRLAVVGWTALRKGLPLITARATPPAVVAALREILQAPSSRASSG